jgi:hypothetical protein
MHEYAVYWPVGRAVSQYSVFIGKKKKMSLTGKKKMKMSMTGQKMKMKKKMSLTGQSNGGQHA